MIPELMVQPSYWIDSDIWISRFDIAILFELCLKSLIKREHRNSPPKPPVHGGLGGEGSGVILLAVSYQYWNVTTYLGLLYSFTNFGCFAFSDRIFLWNFFNNSRWRFSCECQGIRSSSPNFKTLARSFLLFEYRLIVKMRSHLTMINNSTVGDL